MANPSLLQQLRPRAGKLGLGNIIGPVMVFNVDQFFVDD
jgi:hypothetical protein